MSYDISFKVKCEGVDKYVEVGDCCANITWNVRKIIELSTGLPWRNCENNGLCKDVIPHIEKGLSELLNYPQKYRPYEDKDGWGTVFGVFNFFQHILEAWEHLIRDDEELAQIATFWIE